MLSTCATAVHLIWNCHPNRVLQPIANPSLIYTKKVNAHCNEHGTIYAISSDFGDHMTTQSMRLMVLLKWTFLDPRDEVKRLHKAKHEERIQKNAELDEFYRNQ